MTESLFPAGLIKVCTDERISPGCIAITGNGKSWKAWHLDLQVDFVPIEGSSFAEFMKEKNNAS